MADKPWWFELAACRTLDPRTFTAARGGAVQLARTVCSTCPVEEVCLWYAIGLEDPSNRSHVFGGATAPERSVLVRRHGITPEKAREWYQIEEENLIARLSARQDLC